MKKNLPEDFGDTPAVEEVYHNEQWEIEDRCEEWGRENISLLKKLIVEVLERILPYSAIIEGETSITINGTVHVRSTVLEGNKFGWAIDLIKVIHNYPHGPDDIDYAECGTARNFNEAIILIFEVLMKQLIENILDAIGEKEACEECQNDSG